jgi:hypothetical protein
MHYFKGRIFALVLILVSIGLIYYNWHQVLQEHKYSMKLAAFANWYLMDPGFFGR